MKMNNNKPALTLVEVIVYLGLFAILFTSIISFTINVSSINQESLQRLEVSQQIMFVSEHIGDSVLQSLGINTAETIFSTQPGLLYLDTPSGYITYRVDTLDNRLVVNRDGTQNFLTSERYSITDFIIEPINSHAGEKSGFKISFTITSKNSNVSNTFEYSYFIR